MSKYSKSLPEIKTIHGKVFFSLSKRFINFNGIRVSTDSLKKDVGSTGMDDFSK
jgi:hypothetical protein